MDVANICWLCVIKTLLLLFVANGAPVLTRNVFNSNFDTAIDFGVKLPDKRPLFGNSKTWRGVGASVIFTAMFAQLIDISMSLALYFSLLVMSGDLLASFCKRRLGYLESSRMRFLDVVPESALPLLVLQLALGLSWLAIVISIGLFFVFEVVLSPLLYRMHIRKRPY